jgi:hypothetical protein
MSQRAFLQQIDADIHAALAEAGMADTGTYTAPGELSEPVPARCYVNKSGQSAGEYAPTFGARITIDILREDVPAPQVGATVIVDGDTFVLEAPVVERRDDGLTGWVVRHA